MRLARFNRSNSPRSSTTWKSYVVLRKETISQRDGSDDRTLHTEDVKPTARPLTGSQTDAGARMTHSTRSGSPRSSYPVTSALLAKIAYMNQTARRAAAKTRLFILYSATCRRRRSPGMSVEPPRRSGSHERRSPCSLARFGHSRLHCTEALLSRRASNSP